MNTNLTQIYRAHALKVLPGLVILQLVYSVCLTGQGVTGHGLVLGAPLWNLVQILLVDICTTVLEYNQENQKPLRFTLEN